LYRFPLRSVREEKMKKFLYLRLIVLVCIVVIALVFIGMNVVNAQEKAKGKPPDKGKPPKDACNNNGICEKDESDDCADCQNYSALNTEGIQIVTAGDERRVYQIKYEDGTYQNTWMSHLVDADLKGVCIGDIENDGEKEIIAASRSKKKGKERWKLHMYKNGSWGEPYYTSPFLGISTMFKISLQIADADNYAGNGNELIAGMGKQIEIYRWTGNEFIMVWASREFNSGVYYLDIGDADNDGQNEILITAISTQSPIILKYLGNDTWGDEQPIDAVDINCLDATRPRDSDNIMDESGNYDNEVIAGGCNSKLMVWKYNKDISYYESVFISETLDNFTQGVDAGDIDYDGQNEVIVGTAGDGGMIYVFKYTDGEYLLMGSWFCGGCNYLSVGNLDNDPEDEVVVGHGSGIKIFNYDGAELELAFHFPCGNYLDIK
jgi:hypothetical protein